MLERSAPAASLQREHESVTATVTKPGIGFSNNKPTDSSTTEDFLELVLELLFAVLEPSLPTWDSTSWRLRAYTLYDLPQSCDSVQNIAIF